MCRSPWQYSEFPKKISFVNITKQNTMLVYGWKFNFINAYTSLNSCSSLIWSWNFANKSWICKFCIFLSSLVSVSVKRYQRKPQNWKQTQTIELYFCGPGVTAWQHMIFPDVLDSVASFGIFIKCYACYACYVSRS